MRDRSGAALERHNLKRCSFRGNGCGDGHIGTGNRSAHVQKALRQMGSTHIYNVPEGMAGSAAGPGWLRRGLPVEPCPTC